MVQRLGALTIKTTLNPRTPILLAGCEAEFYALVLGGCHPQSAQSISRDLDINADIAVEYDSNAAKALQFDKLCANNDTFRSFTFGSSTKLQSTQSPVTKQNRLPCFRYSDEGHPQRD